MKNSIACLLVLLGLLSGPAWANEVSDNRDDNVQHNFSLTFSPIHLLLPVGELMGEYRILDKISVAGIVGMGAVEAAGDRFLVFVGGAQFRYYPVGSFIHGMQLGAEFYYTYVETGDVAISGSGDGLAVGPFVGYKIATNVGFTFDAQLGAQYLTLRAKATDLASGTSATAKDDKFIVLLNLNIGWSF